MEEKKKRYKLLTNIEVEAKDEGEAERVLSETFRQTWKRPKEEPKVISWSWVDVFEKFSPEAEELDRIFESLAYPQLRKKILEVI